MNLTMQTPEDLSRRALEALALEGFKQGRISKAEMRDLLQFGTRDRLDGFLKEHGVFMDYTIDDFDRDLLSLERAGF